MWVLGLAGSHNGAAALYRDDTLVCAVQEERLSRKKRDVLVPGRDSLAVAAVLSDQGIEVADLDLVVAAPLITPDDPRDLVAHHPTLGRRPTATITHHLAHALSAYACSGFDSATALVVDGMGSYARDLTESERAACLRFDPSHRETVSIYTCAGALTPVEKHLGRTGFATATTTRLGPFASLGLAYQQVARLAFGTWDAAGKTMGLAPYGRPRFVREAFFDIAPDGTFDFHDDLAGIAGLIGSPGTYPADAALHADLAASVQAALEDGLLHLVRRARALTHSRRLVCAGGVFLNSVANERIVASGLFDEVYVVPFAEDSGTAIGAAFHGVQQLMGARSSFAFRWAGARSSFAFRWAGARSSFAFRWAGARSSFARRRLEADALGPLPTDYAAALALAAPYARATTATFGDIATRIAAGEMVGLFTGRSELGPRALGQRSILYDPRRPLGAFELNRKKGREAFRPFAPAVLRTHVQDWFDLAPPHDSPFMLRVAPVLPERRDQIPAVTHVDGSARVQTVMPGSGPLAEIIAAFYAQTGVPMVLNTSFNRAGEPIVESACDAVRSFLALDMRALWLDVGSAGDAQQGVLLVKHEQA